MIEPIADDGDTVTLRRTDYIALLAELEDARDAATIRDVQAKVTAGQGEYVPVDVVQRLMVGDVPVKVWREHRSMTARALAEAAGVPASYLSEIEAGRKPGSFKAMAAIAEALRVDMEDLKPWAQD